MSCGSKSKAEVVRGSVEYLYADINTDRVIDTQPVSMSISTTNGPEAWIAAEWHGSPGKFRSARVLLDGTLPVGSYNVYVRVTDSPESVVVHVGKLSVV